MCSVATTLVCLVLSVHVVNEAAISEQTLLDVRTEVERYFRPVGIAIDWDRGRHAGLTIVLSTATRMREIDRHRRGVLGLAVANSRRAYVLIDRVDSHALEIVQRSGNGRMDRPGMLNRVTGRTILISLVAAHEIGHLLLPPGAHASRGLMSQDVTIDALRRAADRTLVFSVAEGRTMRAALTSVSTAVLRNDVQSVVDLESVQEAP